jgi:molybdopterin/thiamine biosynthesis adenylyltransferase
MYNDSMQWTGQDILRYSRNILLGEIGPSGQDKLLAASALVVGAGGLGSPALMYLAAAGVGRIGIIDGDRVDLSNLNRQLIHRENSVGRGKADSAADALRAFRSNIELEAHQEAITAGNAIDLFGRYDVVVDGSDNFPTKYLLSDASVITGVPLIHAGVVRFGGQIFSVLPRQGPCLRCLIPEIPPRKDSPTCSEAGVLGAAAGVVGSWQAVETVKTLLCIGQPLCDRMLVIDTLEGSVSVFPLRKDPDCPACGKSPRIRSPLSADEYFLERSCAL